MKKLTISLFSALLVATLLIGCNAQQDTAMVQAVDNTGQTLIERSNKVVPYPMGSGLEVSDIDVLRWGLLPENQQEDAKLKSAEIIKEALKIVYGFERDLDRLDSKTASLGILEKAKTAFNKHEFSPSLSLAKQMFAMRVQSFLFQGFLEEPGISSFKNTPLNSDEVQLLTYTTQLLIENGNPNADLVALNLDIINDRLAPEVKSDLASAAIQNTQNWYGDELSEPGNAKESMQKIASVKSGITKLESFL